MSTTGDIGADSVAIRRAAGGRAHLVFDQVGRATDHNGLIAAMRTLRRGGRLVVMGSAAVPLAFDYNELLINDWEIIGNFMYADGTYEQLLALVRAGLLDLGAVRARTFAMDTLPAAIDHAATMRGLDCTLVTMTSD